MAKEMLINTVAGQECRIAIVEDGRLEELYIERTSSATHVSNIYKGRVTNVEPSIQAAFIDFGLTKNGFLHISDIHPQYFPEEHRTEVERVGRKHPHRQRPPIQNCLRRGQEVVVQMTKEGIGTKGPTMTTYLSIPGRLLVMMPTMSRLGVSRKVEDIQVREKARQALSELKLPADMGFILRTAGIGRPKRELQRDLNYLLRLWGTVKQRIAESKAPAEIYQESDLVIRTIRDVYNTEIDRVVCDDQDVERKVREFLDVAMPRTKHRIELYAGTEGLFHDYGLEQEIEKIYDRRVTLRSGGSLVIDQTEALVAVDVNSGRFREHSDAETTALKTNLEAAEEIARQLRLRDMGGVIIIDFIDMRDLKNRRAVDRALRNTMKDDRAKTKILRISSFGIVEMTRQRIRPSLKDSIYRRCTFCDGTGLIKSEESQSLLVMRCLQRATANEEVARVEIDVTPSAAQHLGNYQRRQIGELEASTGTTVIIRGDPDLGGDEVRVKCTNSRGSEVAWARDRLAGRGKRTVKTVEVGMVDKAEPAPPPEEAPEGEKIEKKAKKSRPRGKRGGRKHKTRAEQAPEDSEEQKAEVPAEETEEETAKKAKKSRRRGRRGGRKHKKPNGQAAEEGEKESQGAEETTAGRVEASQEQAAEQEAPTEEAAGEEKTAKKAKKSRRRGRRGGKKHKKPGEGSEEQQPEKEAPGEESTMKAQTSPRGIRRKKANENALSVAPNAGPASRSTGG